MPSTTSPAKRVLYIEGNVDGTVGGSYFLMYDLVTRLDRSRYEPLVGFYTDNFLIDRLREHGVEVIVFPRPTPFRFQSGWLGTWLGPIKKAINLYRGLIAPALAHARFLRERRIDLVNVNNSIAMNHAWMLAALLTGTPCITHEMGISPRYSALARFFGKRLARIVALSHAIHSAMRACGIDYSNIVVIHCAIDLARYRLEETPEALRARHGIPDGAPIIGVVGNIRAWKGQETIVRATALLKDRYPDIRCMLVGACGEADREYGDFLHTLAAQLGVTDNVIFAGFQRNSIDYMRLMDVVVHTSIHPEPFGIVTLEAMSLAKPLVSTTIGGPAEVVIDRETGLLVTPGEPALLAGAIGTFLDDPRHAAEVGRRGLERLKTHFGMQQQLDRTMEVYRQALRSGA
jgi:glycosyltransferase involved in cell wall biosynthesis